MAKRRAGSRTTSLTPDHKKSRIDPIYLAAGGVSHIIGKFLTRATTLLQIALRSEVCSQCYGVPKSQESHLARFWDSHSGVPRKIAIWMQPPWRAVEYTIKGEGGGFPQVRAVVSLVCLCCPWLVLAPRVFQLCINHFVWVVCRPV